MRCATVNTAYCRVLRGRGTLKVKLAALSRLPAPSGALLSEIIRDPNANPKLRLLAADRLAELIRQRSINKALKEEQ